MPKDTAAVAAFVLGMLCRGDHRPLGLAALRCGFLFGCVVASFLEVRLCFLSARAKLSSTSSSSTDCIRFPAAAGGEEGEPDVKGGRPGPVEEERTLRVSEEGGTGGGQRGSSTHLGRKVARYDRNDLLFGAFSGNGGQLVILVVLSQGGGLEGWCNIPRGYGICEVEAFVGLGSSGENAAGWGWGWGLSKVENGRKQGSHVQFRKVHSCCSP